MSVIVKGVEIPKSCSKCGWFDMGGGDGYRCTLLHKSFDMWNKISVARDKNCPLVEIPTPHGRLGDLDALYAMINEADDYGADMADILRLILQADTIIGAEGSEE